MTSNPLPTQNTEWGFFGTIDRGGELAAKGAWAEASRQLAEACGLPDDEFRAEGIRAFLDGRLGRHFADTVNGNASRYKQPVDVAISEAIAEWQRHQISKQTSRDHGIPMGLPQLTGWIFHHAIEAEAEADE
ncbi:MAG: hypothetical protein GY772_25560 [bacterium]|nr:hypothetical protein [bacterium]